MQSISNAKIHFNPQGTPVATEFDDIYFSNEGGLAETEYVFLQQNALPERWHTHPHAFFHILETGFGTGANFLLCWQRFRSFKAQHPAATCQRLYFSSFEKYPLSLADLRQALASHSMLQTECEQLLAAYPPPTPGCHRLVFEHGQVILDLWQGDVNALLPQLPAQNKVDAIFLDGFAPAKNPDMWQSSLFEQLFRLSHSNTTLATFTCAGLVKRGLTAAGFHIQKVKGFGRKREMLTATATFSAETTVALQAQQSSTAMQPNLAVTIVGGGLAALCSAFALVRRGLNVRMLCADAAVAEGASHNRQGALYPNLSVSLSPASLWHCQAFYFARQFYQLCQQQGIDFPLQFCGLLHLATTTPLAERQKKMALQQSWPTSLVRFVEAAEASTLANIPLQHRGIFIPDAGWLAPQAFCQALFTYLNAQANFSAHFNCKVTQILPAGSGWQVHSAHQVFDTANLLVATGADLTQLSPFVQLPLNRVRGQVSHVQSAILSSLETVICHKGYVTPAWQGLHCVGATFDRTATEAAVTAADNDSNIQELAQQLNLSELKTDLIIDSAKAAFRGTLPDHLPLAGQLNHSQPNLWVQAGLGARGLLFAPLLAEILACQLSGEPIPASDATLGMLSPQRFKV
ncbi:bifunctional tRNA (5-methylaminomethyl-2-thiouridine)(34)-methyltransferase MnmD/FAD-dependent 5-carboxymethylaminomethyl-2-thiouridine(34) oxidoreductase MnmC [Alishewanella sp. d11]|uniref:bifunctional tRNA (5-methylaminomethyl-2-thiouridine)(34)-methyltransferase MnmD/FAD-dependent 5-carboxymethylaminomethyl-2-thiouridine(34) oxidoreductase MnmC n=1 Tax=Alishewanella sp. d11 TaxID=3414030 RepID=UPI003BF928A2